MSTVAAASCGARSCLADCVYPNTHGIEQEDESKLNEMRVLQVRKNSFCVVLDSDN